PGWRAEAARRPAQAITPSTSTGTPRAAPSTMKPARAAISRAPTSARGSPAIRARARSTTVTLRPNVASSTPVPRPVPAPALGPHLACEHVDGGTAGAEVGDHLGRHLLRPGRDALGDDAVVTGEDGDRRRLGRGRGAFAGDAGQTHTEVLQTPERTPGLGQAI